MAIFRTYLLFVFAVFTASLTVCQVTSSAWQILVDGMQGPIHPQTARQDLVAKYGDENVVDRDLKIGGMRTSTVLFPDDPERSMGIAWGDTEKKSSPRLLVIQGTKSRWTGPHGVSLGMTLKQLERLNGKPFEMTGYGWDYAGTVTSWNDGKLARDFGEFNLQLGERGSLMLRLNGCKNDSSGEENQLLGDGNFSSSIPVLQKMDPCVSAIVWMFPKEALD